MTLPQKHGILIADDHSVVRMGLKSLIRRAPDLQVVGEAANGLEAVARFHELRPDLTVMDLRMPVKGGVEAIAEIRMAAPAAAILVLSTSDGDEDIFRALEAGAAGYVLKHSSDEELVPAIRKLLAGKGWLSSEVSKQLAWRSKQEPLTERERDVLKLLSRGEANKQIADLLAISENTVKTHLRSILAKLQVRDRTEAVTVALRRGIIHLSER